MDLEPSPASSRLTVILLLPHRNYPPPSQVCGSYVLAQWNFPATGMAYVIYPVPFDAPTHRQHPVVVLPRPPPPLDGVPNAAPTDSVWPSIVTAHVGFHCLSAQQQARALRLHYEEALRRPHEEALRQRREEALLHSAFQRISLDE
ncbi:hypothetical protein BD626DRAFT_576199 [Schizophyllum amplum]|uniref:Uncharacterized protein n=1 Tax=Schizophyllum amplum TaxID=97359 RepID=A0A550BU34_9AGAR|nr:hypothetical protein BD626DRAFT_576199 [Auriculariopsis ampla]